MGHRVSILQKLYIRKTHHMDFLVSSFHLRRIPQNTADFINWFIEAAQEALAKNNDTGATGIVTRGAGAIKFYESFTDRYKFKSPIFVSSYPLYKGIARFLRIPIEEPKKSGKKLIIDDKCKTAAKLIKKHDMIILHIKDPDTAGLLFYFLIFYFLKYLFFLESVK